MVIVLSRSLLSLTVIAALSGAWLSTHRNASNRGQSIWVFDENHQQMFSRLCNSCSPPAAQRSVSIDLMPTRAMDMRLPVLFMSSNRSADVPLAIELEISSLGRYLRPPADEIGFLPLDQYLSTRGQRQIDSLQAPGQSGWRARLIDDGKIYTFDGSAWRESPGGTQPDTWIDRLLPNRLLPAKKDGHIFALPNDVHPVALLVREDLFAEAGAALIDDAGHPVCSAWPQFRDRCIAFQTYWRRHGHPTRHAVELPSASAGMLWIMLIQRHLNPIDAGGTIHLNDPRVAQTLAFYASMVAGPSCIAGEAPADTGLEYKDLTDGNLCAMLCPDWRAASLARHVPQLAGAWRLIPLPRFDPTDAPTASYGGTFIAIPRQTANPEAAWKVIEHLYFSPEALAEQRKLGVLPALPEAWNDSDYDQADAYFGGQKPMRIYADLAWQTPPVEITPSTLIALGTLSYVQSMAVAYASEHGTAGLEAKCQAWLDAAAVDLRRRIEHSWFE